MMLIRAVQLEELALQTCKESQGYPARKFQGIMVVSEQLYLPRPKSGPPLIRERLVFPDL